jgi:AcrR family transcriptional regulator
LHYQHRIMAKKETITDSLSTEEKFKEAARIVFTKKGYAGTKTRDIAEEAGLNLALLNYYFRSKEKLFEIIMMEKVQQLFSFIAPITNDQSKSLYEKIDLISKNYINLLIKNPDLPLFVLSEIRNNPKRFGKMVQLDKMILQSHFIKQLAEQKKDINPLQLLLSFLGMLVFPFIASPILNTTGALNEAAFNHFMEQRKTLVAQWMKVMLE